VERRAPRGRTLDSEMSPARRLEPAELRRPCAPEEIPFPTTADAEEIDEYLGQDRAIEAIAFALAMRGDGWNVYAAGPAGTGKETLLRRFLARAAATRPRPSDWCYVYNFRDPRRPRALELPAGRGAGLAADLARTVAELRYALPAAFEGDEYRTRKQQLARRLAEQREAAFTDVQERARGRDVTVVRTDTGVVFAPTRDGSMLEPDQVRALPDEARAAIDAALRATHDDLAALFAHIHDWEKEHRDAVARLDQETAARVAGRLFGALAASYAGLQRVLDYLGEVEADVVERAGEFLSSPENGLEAAVRRALRNAPVDGPFRRYQVNVVIDHSGTAGAPVVFEDRPTHAGLVGRIEHTVEMGALSTDFTLIRPGALHRAAGGYLVLDALRVLQAPWAWESLKRTLRRGEIRLESIGQQLGLTDTVTLEPEPIGVQGVKVLLIGDRYIYHLLAEVDPDFLELFKVVADFEDATPRGADTQALYGRLLAQIARDKKLPPFDRAAIARMVEQAARLAGDGEKLSVHLRPIVDLLDEAAFAAERAGRELVGKADVEAAIEAQRRRAGRVRERLQEAVSRGVVLLDTAGAAVGQVNGLMVIAHGEVAFGHPARITARVRAGKGEVVDIEREVELGGPIHSKGVLILGGFLGGRYLADGPLSLTATLVFEQSYGPVEGDSASLAELCALLSALALEPLSQTIAVTGSVNQNGQVQAVGGVNEKIEGFFDVCAERGLSGDQGVILPAANVQHLMLRADVVEAVAAGRFAIWAVERVDDAIEVLIGRAPGERDDQGAFPEGSFNAFVEGRLAALAEGIRMTASETLVNN
jgi:predicted ATP-dependent protease